MYREFPDQRHGCENIFMWTFFSSKMFRSLGEKNQVHA